MYLALKESEPLTLSVLTFHSSTQNGVTSTPTPSHTLLSLCFLSSTLRAASRQKSPEVCGKKGSLIIQLPLPFGYKRMYFQTCLSLVHRSQSQKGRVPPIGAQPESSLFSITTYPLSLFPLLHTDSPYVFTQAQRKS